MKSPGSAVPGRLYIRSLRVQGEVDREGGYLASLPAVRALIEKDLHLSSRVTCFVGENGTGKSTLLEAVAVCAGFNAEGGSRNYCFSTRATESALYRYMELARADYPRDGFFLRAESFYNVASELEKLDEQPAAAPLLTEAYGGRSLHRQSHGESFLSLVRNRFRGRGLYILDEPEAALSPARQMSLLVEIDRLVKAGSQLLIATHSPIVMAYPGAEIYCLCDEGIRLTPYEQTDHYCLTRQFLNCPEQMLRRLLEKND